MRLFFRHLGGGVAICIAASLVGLAHNAVRSNPVKLVQKIDVVSTASHDKDAAGAADTSGAATPAEGSIDVAGVKALVDAGTAVILDARAPDAFAAGHIPGAVNIPYDQLPQFLETLQLEATMDDQIVCYCWSTTCDFSDQLATELKLMGYENVLVFTGGWEHWNKEGHPTETGGNE